MVSKGLLTLTWGSVLAVTLLVSRPHGAQSLDFVYHAAEELEVFLTNISRTYPDITHLHSIGKSVNGTDLWVITIGQSPRDHVLLRPNVKYVGNMHGNEVVGREELLHFVDYLVTNYGHLDNVTQLLNNATLHILPTMNPDGYLTASTAPGGTNCVGVVGRGNALGYDLNRNFPDFFRNHTRPIQPEAKAIVDWIHATQFVLSANLHGGAVCANYPFDNYLGDVSMARPHLSPDDDVYVHLAKTYSFAHPFMSIIGNCPSNNFTDGITNGAAWYPITGSMQDYNYIMTGGLELTLEVSCCKFPQPPSELEHFWNADRDPLLLLAMQVNMGVRGLVTDQAGNAVEGAVVTIQGREMISSKTTKHGEYWRMLLPGHYRLMVSADGCKPKIAQFQVVNNTVSRLDVTIDTQQFVSDKAVSTMTSQALITLTTSLAILLYARS